jgi:phenylalanine-4-hydroxylase
MAYKTGGIAGLTKAVQAESINSVEFENGLQISGVLKKFFVEDESKTNAEGKKVSYLQFNGPTQISFNNKQINGHGKDYHAQGYGTPVGGIKNFELNDLKTGTVTELHYESGVKVKGTLKNILRLSDKAVILTFENATCDYNGEILFQPEWGAYDIVLANEVTSVFGGPADRGAYGAVDDFVASRVPTPKYSDQQLKLFKDYQAVRDLRTSGNFTQESVTKLFSEFKNEVPNEWLLFLELLEMAVKKNFSQDLIQNLDSHLQSLAKKNETVNINITSGLKLAYEKF